MSPQVFGLGGHCVNDDRADDAVDRADFEEVAGSVGADEHGEAIVEIVCEYRVVECVDDVFAGDVVLWALEVICGTLIRSA